MSNEQENDKIIMEKLENLPVPDMENRIWNRIDAMLDAMPAPTDKFQSSSVKNYKKYLKPVTIAIITAIICIIIIKKKQRAVKNDLPVPVFQKKATIIDSLETLPGNNTKLQPVEWPFIKRKVAVNDSMKGKNIHKDSQHLQPVLVDSSNKSVVPLVVVSVKDSITNFPKDSAASLKKPKGVKGITDSDYRILPVKKNE